MINQETKKKIFTQFGQSAADTGSCEVQVALFSAQIRSIAEHLKSFPKDRHSQRGLLILVGKRRAFLGYLKKKNSKNYDKIMESLRSNGYM